MSIATGSVVEQLNTEYAGQVIFIEDNVDTPVGGRDAYWWAAFGGGSVYLPLSMVDSGHAIQSGYDSLTTYQDYKAMIDAALARPALARVEGIDSTRLGDHLEFELRVTNLGTAAIPASAEVHVLVYEAHSAVAGEHITGRILRAHTSQTLNSELAPGASATFNLQTGDLSNITDWEQVHAVALVDVLPSGSQAYDMLQAAVVYPPEQPVITPTIPPEQNNHIYLPFIRRQ